MYFKMLDQTETIHGLEVLSVDKINSHFHVSIDFSLSQEAFKSDVLIGSDVFLKSSPTEIHRFFEFVERHTPFSVVIDGLNLMYQHSTNKNFTEVRRRNVCCNVECGIQ